MAIQWMKRIPVITMLLLFSGCSIFTRNQAPEKAIIDSFVERDKQWSEQINQGNWALQNQDLRHALKAYQAALAIKPRSSEPQLKIGEIYFQLQEYENARNAFVAFLKLDATNTNVWNYLGYIYEKLNNYEAATEAYEGALKSQSNNLYALNHLGLAYKKTHRLNDAERVLRKALEIDPKCTRSESKNLHNYLAVIHLEREEVGEAVAEYRESARIYPKDIWARQQLASVYENHGRYFEAQLQYQDILKIDPQNLLAPTRLQALAQLSMSAPAPADVSPVDLIDIDTDAIIAQAPDASDYPDADVIILINQFSHEVLPTGQSRYTTHQVIKLLTERGIRKYDDIAIPYQSTAQHIAVNIARTILPNGSVVEPPDEAFNDVTPPGLLSYNLYSDMMWKVISMPALEPGVCIEYQVTLEDAAAQSVGSKTWLWGGFNFQSTETTLQTNYALRLPKDTKFRWKSINCQLNPQVFQEEETTTYLWTYGETSGLKQEIGMPPINEVAARFSFSSVESWDAVYKWYKDLAKDRYTVDEAIEEMVQKLTAELETREAKIREIYHYVASQIRYVGIELGQGAYQPSPATQVFSKKYGDCKDKTTLMIAMLDLAGIEAYPVLINPSPHERIDIELPSVSQFSHVIAAIPQGDDSYIWLDATSDTCTYGDLPDSDQGRKGFLLGNEQGEFVDIPTFPSASNQLISLTEMRLNSDGSVQGEMRLDTKGQYSLDARLRYKQIPPSDLSDTLATELSKQFPGVKIDWVEISDLSNLNVPVRIKIGFHVENYVKSIDEHLLLPLPIDEFVDYAELFAAAEREYSLNLSYPMQMEKEIRIALPEGWTAALPDDLHEEHDFAIVNRKYEHEGNDIRYKLHFTLKKPIIAPEDYPAAKRFFDRLAREDGTHLILSRVKSRS